MLGFADKKRYLTVTPTPVIINAKTGIKEELMGLPKYYNPNCIFLYCEVDKRTARQMICNEIPIPLKLYETPKIAYEVTKNAVMPNRVCVRIAVNTNAGIVCDEFSAVKVTQDQMNKATCLRVYNKTLKVIEYEIRRIEHVVVSSISIID